MQDIMRLCDTVRETAFAIHKYHKQGHLEKVYENALTHRLRKLGLDVKQQHPLTVYDEDGTVIGEYFADLFVEGRLMNFGAPRFEIRKYAFSQVTDDRPRGGLLSSLLGFVSSALAASALLRG